MSDEHVFTEQEKEGIRNAYNAEIKYLARYYDVSIDTIMRIRTDRERPESWGRS